MKTRIVRIGNSQGIRIPKPLLEAAGLHGEVNLTAEYGVIMIRPAQESRTGWAEAFHKMGKYGDDAVSADIPPTLYQGDTEEWEWK